ncbi:MAG TPA: family 78 glycoside hydrolase catalytic domain [Erysipelotrichaceae bacterium]|nr:family 78 glycoside hydrolase catalytic domain [Erysipelotrichaceae bacterium]
MLKVIKFIINGSNKSRYIDENPFFGFALESDKEENYLKSAQILVNNEWKKEVIDQIRTDFDGKLTPFSHYAVKLKATDRFGDVATYETSFDTGRLQTPWTANWISDGKYKFTGKGSPKVMTFVKKLHLDKIPEKALISITTLGVYKLYINGKRVGEDYFTPGFTNYKENLQYQIYDIKKFLKKDNEIKVVVAGGWAVGDFTYGHKNRISADRQALKAEIRLEDKKKVETIPTDESWLVTTKGPYIYVDLYDGEIYDANLVETDFHEACLEKVKTNPKKLTATYGEFVRLHESFLPVSVSKSPSGEDIYKFEQNFSGVVKFKVKNAKKGQRIVIRHAEVLHNGELCTKLLRKAKCTIEYICKDGNQEFIPTFTYMGFQYIGVSGIEKENIEIEARAIYSDIETVGSFSCSDKRINQLQQNIVWSAKSNFVEIPTDCPQRDERMGWTGDIGLFSLVACYNFDMQIFLKKWLKDMRSEQIRTGGFPNTIPSQSHGFPLTMPHKAIDFWGDACVMVPWALYMAHGDKTILIENYETIKKYHKACLWWANFLSFGKSRYIWKSLSMLHFGDWVAPDTDKMSEWQKRHKWTATASLANTSKMLADIATILGKNDDAIYYQEIFQKVSDAYESKLTDGQGLILGKQFQTAYVLPLAFDMFKEETKPLAVENLVKIVEEKDYCVATGFPGTPYILFALADNGREDVAFKMLFNDKCPSWLYPVKVGATTMWERWDALKADGTLNFAEEDGTGGMVSFNHYALGAVGDFLYRRLLGLEPLEGGYKSFIIKPLYNCGLDNVSGKTMTPYGEINVMWKKSKKSVDLSFKVPFGTKCQVVTPRGEIKTFRSGNYSLVEEL